MSELLLFVPSYVWIVMFRRSFVDWLEWMGYENEKINFWNSFSGFWQPFWPILMAVHFVVHLMNLYEIYKYRNERLFGKLDLKNRMKQRGEFYRNVKRILIQMDDLSISMDGSNEDSDGEAGAFTTPRGQQSGQSEMILLRELNQKSQKAKTNQKIKDLNSSEGGKDGLSGGKQASKNDSKQLEGDEASATNERENKKSMTPKTTKPAEKEKNSSSKRKTVSNRPDAAPRLIPSDSDDESPDLDDSFDKDQDGSDSDKKK